MKKKWKKSYFRVEYRLKVCVVLCWAPMIPCGQLEGIRMPPEAHLQSDLSYVSVNVRTCFGNEFYVGQAERIKRRHRDLVCLG